MSRVSRGAVELRDERLDAASVVALAIETSEPVIRAAGHDLSVESPDSEHAGEARIARLFDLFVRGPESDRRHREGLGVGLALARRLAELHGGSLSGASEGPGRGSEFTLRLPLDR